MSQYIADKNLYEIGLQAIQYFQNEMVMRYEKYRITQNQLLAELEKQRGGKALVEGLGLAIQQGEIGAYRINDAMKSLAKASNGKIPSKGSFFSALNDEMGSLSFSDYGEMGIEIVKDLAEKTASGGQKILDTASGVADSAVSIGGNLKWILPAVLFLGVGLYVWKMPK